MGVQAFSDKVFSVATKRETDQPSATFEKRLDPETVANYDHAVATQPLSKGYGYMDYKMMYEDKMMHEDKMSREEKMQEHKTWHDEEKGHMDYGRDDGVIDPMDELLDAYQAFLRTGVVEFANEVMGLVHELQDMMVGKMRDYMKSHSMDMGYMNPIGCLSQAYLATVMNPETKPLSDKILNLMSRAADSMLGAMGEMNEDNSESSTRNDMDGRGVVVGGTDNPSAVRREIRMEDNQFCVYSETGRAFGCYNSRQGAEERLAQIERFSEQVVRQTPVDKLVEMHKQAHHLDRVSPQVKDAHDIISDELEVVHGMAEPYAIPVIVKEAMMTRLEQGFVSKAIEYRYTLGPAYVPMREDAHGEFADTETLQKAMWDWVRKGDRTIYLQHSDKAAGEMVEMMTMPFPLEAELTVPNQGVTKYTFPADTPFLGVVWEPWAWELVKSGQLRGYSIGGSAKRVEADLPVDALV